MSILQVRYLPKRNTIIIVENHGCKDQYSVSIHDNTVNIHDKNTNEVIKSVTFKTSKEDVTDIYSVQCQDNIFKSDKIISYKKIELINIKPDQNISNLSDSQKSEKLYQQIQGVFQKYDAPMPKTYIHIAADHQIVPLDQFRKHKSVNKMFLKPQFPDLERYRKFVMDSFKTTKEQIETLYNSDPKNFYDNFNKAEFEDYKISDVQMSLKNIEKLSKMNRIVKLFTTLDRINLTAAYLNGRKNRSLDSLSLARNPKWNFNAWELFGSFDSYIDFMKTLNDVNKNQNSEFYIHNLSGFIETLQNGNPDESLFQPSTKELNKSNQIKTLTEAFYSDINQALKEKSAYNYENSYLPKFSSIRFWDKNQNYYVDRGEISIGQDVLFYPGMESFTEEKKKQLIQDSKSKLRSYINREFVDRAQSLLTIRNQ